ncbi:MAG: hypothetical protein ACOC2U_04465 [bacterium]
MENNGIYFQPDFKDNDTLKTKDGIDFYSFFVYRNYHNAKKDFPNTPILAYSGDDIEEPTYMD